MSDDFVALPFVASGLPMVIAFGLLVAAPGVERPAARHYALHALLPGLALIWLHRLGGLSRAFWLVTCMSGLALVVLRMQSKHGPDSGMTRR